MSLPWWLLWLWLWSGCCGNAFIVHVPPPRRLPSTALFQQNQKNNNDNNNLSAAARERRDEEKRQKERQQDVVIGKTSALPDAQDYPLNPSRTEQEYLRQASREEQLIYKQTERGLQYLKGMNLPDAERAFDAVYSIKPNAYLWQAGVCKFYRGKLVQAERILETSAEFYEGRFGMVASEERIWQSACLLKLRQEGVELDEKEEQQNKEEEEEQDLMPETRMVLRMALDLFTASMENDYSAVVLSRAKLRSACLSGQVMRKVTAWFYLGLHYDVLGQVEESIECLKAALRACPSVGNGDDIVHTLPALHMATRDWYDQEEFTPDNDVTQGNGQQHANEKNGKDGATARAAAHKQQPQANNNSMRTSPVVIHSIRSSVEKLKLAQLQEALRTRGLKGYGSKKELQEKLFQSLIEDSGLD